MENIMYQVSTLQAFILGYSRTVINVGELILFHTLQSFLFENIRGSLVGVYFPDYLDGINMPGWHLHFLSEDTYSLKEDLESEIKSVE